MAEALIIDPPLPTEIVYQFPNPTWIENLAVRSNGQLLLTVMTKPELYLVDPTNPSTATLIHTFPSVLGLTGIVETNHDIFYVAGGNYNTTTWANEAGSYSIWKVDLTSFDKNLAAKVEEVTTLPDAGLPNGLERLGDSVLVADSEVGCVWKVDVETGDHNVMIQVDEMKTPPPPGFPMGINGLKILDGYLYWTNTGKMMFCRVPIDEEGKPSGAVEVLEKNWLVDDFAFDSKGKAWFAQNPLNTVGAQKKGGGMAIVAGKVDEFTAAGGTACQSGRGKDDKHVLYLVTTGGLASPVNGATEGGKVVAIDTSGFNL